MEGFQAIPPAETSGPSLSNHQDTQRVLDSRSSTPSTLSRKRSLLSKSSAWRLSSLESILEYKEANDLEKRALTVNDLSAPVETVSSDDTTTDRPRRRLFRCTAAEVAFCFSMALTQLLAEYMISGFSVILPTLLSHFSDKTRPNFWPASILSLTLCSTILTFARISDMYGGYPVFMLAVLWFCVWCLIAGFSTSLVLLDICRAMQGLAIAAYTPSSFALFGCIYPTGPRRNMVLGIYGACAPLGFFAGIYVSAALPPESWEWYFWIASVASFIALITSYLSVPSDRADRPSLNLKMDWGGAISITSGLILVVYALAASADTAHAWQSPAVLAPLLIGIACLIFAVYVEARLSKCPLLPFEFFRPRPLALLTVACIFFYGSFGTWLYTATIHLRLAYGVTGLKLAAWFAPMAAGGFVFATLGSSILHIMSPTLVLLISALAWVAAPLLLALGNPSAGYWPFVFPAMLCATLGIDVTFTIASVVLSSTSPLRWQGLAGAVNSTTVNLGIAFALAVAQIIQSKTGDQEQDVDAQLLGHRDAFLFAAASAAIGLVIVVMAVRIPRTVVGTADDDGGSDEEVEMSNQ